MADARLAAASRAREASGNFTGELRLRRKGGESFEAALTSARVVGTSGQAYLWLSVRDLTEERAGARVVSRLRAALESSTDAFFLLEAVRDARGDIEDFVFLEANGAAAKMTGRAREALVGRRLRDAVPAAYELGQVQRAIDVVTSGAPVDAEIPVQRPTGRAWLHVRILKVDDGFAATVTEVTTRKEAEMALREREDELAALSDASAEALVVHRDDGTILATNRTAREMFGMPADGGVGRALMDFVAPDSRALVRKRVESESAEAYEAAAQRADGTAFPVIAQGRTIAFRGGKARLVAIRDMTELRKMEASLAFADRMASVGTLAAGVAHEINNPLSFVTLNVENTIRTLSSGRPLSGAERDAILESLRDAKVGAERVRDIVRDLKTFSRADDESSGPVDLTAAIHYAARMAAAEIRARARLSLDTGELPRVVGNETRLGQVFLNLLLNAAEAIPPGDTARNEIRVTARERAPFVVVSVSDTGVGITPERRARIFDPFVTNKPGGTGLGLAICHGIVTRLGGRLSVESEPGRGATFSVSLPIATAAPLTAPTRAETPMSPPAAVKPRVLLIDDEAMLLRTGARVLEPQCHVVTRASANVALAEIDGGAEFDVVLCDLLMPEMTGMAFYEALVERHAELAKRVVFLSGGVFTQQAQEFLARAPRPCVDKPFSVETLRGAVQSVLDEARARR